MVMYVKKVEGVTNLDIYPCRLLSLTRMSQMLLIHVS